MTAPLTVDVVGWVIDRLATSLPGVGVDEATPDNLESQVPFVRVLRIGGPNDGYRLDFPTLAFHCYDTSQAKADRLGYRVIAAVTALRGVYVAGATCGRVRTLSGPSFAATDNQNLRHAVVLMQPVIHAA